jgi:twitching motility protein PilJ
MLTQRLAKNANALLAGETIDPEVAFLLGKDTNEFRGLLAALHKGSDAMRLAPAKDPETAAKLAELGEAFKSYQESVASILGNMQRLIAAKNAAFAIFNDSEKLLASSETLAAQYEQVLASSRTIYLIGAFALAAFALLALMARAYLRDERRRREQAETQQAQATRQNEQTQAAILRLMNEMQGFAGGDLTAHATVTEEITGAIADSVNFAIEELRTLVGRINTAAEQVTSASESAQRTSGELLAAAEKQSDEIRSASAQVLGMARAINDVSVRATESANVARASLASAEKGQGAVHDAIAGMNEIRDQIQETAKRIKRLGESSQEIGDIVALINGIAEQTNVLALNAAIQAASAGGAGKGFAVVADEVQQLAERATNATRRIETLVQTIQADTSEAVESMESTTTEVVSGTRLAEDAGTALRQTEKVSNELSSLIQGIAQEAQEHSAQATRISELMHAIRDVSVQTSEGSKQAAGAVENLAELVLRLRESVADFKLPGPD